MKDALRTIETLKARVAELESQLSKARGGKSASVADAIGRVISEGVVSGNPAPGLDTSKMFTNAKKHAERERKLKNARTPEERVDLLMKEREGK